MAMRFVLAVFVAMTLTILWQTAVLAEIAGSKPRPCMSDSHAYAAGDKKTKTGTDGPECF